jgi:streptogramin lyase
LWKDDPQSVQTFLMEVSASDRVLKTVLPTTVVVVVVGFSSTTVHFLSGPLAMLGRVDPRAGQIKEYPLKTPHSGPHGLIEDQEGKIWYTANAAGLIGKLDPKTGEVSEYPMPDPAARDPQTLAFDQRPQSLPSCR